MFNNPHAPPHAPSNQQWPPNSNQPQSSQPPSNLGPGQSYNTYPPQPPLAQQSVLPQSTVMHYNPHAPPHAPSNEQWPPNFNQPQSSQPPSNPGPGQSYKPQPEQSGKTWWCRWIKLFCAKTTQVPQSPPPIKPPKPTKAPKPTKRPPNYNFYNPETGEFDLPGYVLSLEL